MPAFPRLTVAKRCACGCEYTRAEFEALDHAGRSTGPATLDGVEWLDYRLCARCRSTITLEVPPPDVDTPHEESENRP